MVYFVGIALILIFLAFAALMFLERLSALLALPLMAVAFLLVAAGADLLAPAEVIAPHEVTTTDAFGRVTKRIESQPQPSRFAQWQHIRQTKARLLHARVSDWSAAAAQIAALAQQPGTTREIALATLRQLHAADEAALRQGRATLDALPDYFARPPAYGGPRARFLERYRSLTLSPRLRPLVSAIERVGWPAAQADAHHLASELSRDVPHLAGQHPPPPPVDSFRARCSAACAYLYEYLVATLGAGSLRLYTTIIVTIFGGMFAVYVRNLKVAEQLVYWTAEFAGERPFVIALAVFIVTAGIFTSVGGLGTVIMLGTIILPILRSVGLSPIVGAGSFLIAIAMGGTLMPSARRFWLDFYGLSSTQLDPLLWTMVGLYLLVGVGWLAWGTRRGLLSSFHAVAASTPPRKERLPALLLAAPVIPVLLVYLGRVEEVTAFTLSIAYMFLCVCRRRGAVRVLARALIEGAQTVMPPVLLMIGIGILVTALATEPVQGALQPLLTYVPSRRWGYIALFALAAPLALYRGPLNAWGMGPAVAATLLVVTTLPPPAVLGIILAAGMLQGISDPTNTANVWIAGFQGLNANHILRATLLPVWLAAAAAIVIFGLWYVPA